MAAVEWHGDALHLHLYIQPRASRDAFGEPHGDELRLRITAPPVDGKANSHLIKFLAKAFRVPKSAIELRAGGQSRHKWLIVHKPASLPAPIAVHLDGIDT